MPTYASLDEIKAELKTTSTTDDAKVRRLALQASARLDRIFDVRRPLFFPYIETRQFLMDYDLINSALGTFRFRDNLLAVSSATAGSETLTVGTTVELWPTLASPSQYLRLKNVGDSWYTYCTSDGSPQSVTIVGTWGFNRDYPNAWIAVDALASGINASVTSMTVADADGADQYGFTPRFSPGQLLKIDDEFLEVTAVNTGTQVLTVRRGVFGSTAAVHSSSASVYVWQVEEPVKRLIARQTAFMYARQGAFESATINDFGVINFPADLLSEVYGILQGYAYI